MSCTDCKCGARDDCFNSAGVRFDCRTKATRAMAKMVCGWKRLEKDDLPREYLFDAKGIIVWAGMRWYGVPMPVRWYLWWRFGHPLSGYGSCGCIVVVKDFWEECKRISRWVWAVRCRMVHAPSVAPRDTSPAEPGEGG